MAEEAASSVAMPLGSAAKPGMDSSSAAQPALPVRRARDGSKYTQKEFRDFYGNDDEWEAAQIVILHPDDRATDMQAPVPPEPPIVASAAKPAPIVASAAKPDTWRDSFFVTDFLPQQEILMM